MVRAARPRGKISSSYKDTEFFKVYLPSLSSKQLAIPPAYARHLKGTMPKHVILRDYVGRRWHGNIEEVEGILVIKDCWQSFACQHSLEHGDFLVFRYNGRSLFDVKIYGINGCLKDESLFANMHTTHEEKETPIANMNAICVKKETETEPDDRACKQEDSETILLKSETEPDDRACKQEDSETILLKSGSSVASRIKTMKRVFKAARYVVPKNPHFVSVIGRYSRYAMSVSVTAVRSHDIKLKPDMMLVDQNGGKWPVKITFRKDGRIAITRGWANFRRKQKLETGDKCIFEFVLCRGNISKEMKVQVVRQNKT